VTGALNNLVLKELLPCDQVCAI